MFFKKKNDEFDSRVEHLRYLILIEMTIIKIERIKMTKNIDMDKCLGTGFMKSLKNKTVDRKRLEKIYYTIIKRMI